MAQADLSTTPKERVLDPFGQTGRTDSWWAGSLATALGLGAFIVYSTFRALYNGEYDFGEASQLLAGLEAANQPTDKVASHAHLLSPFYSPTIIWPGMPKWLSPAFLILWAPGGFRLTCYYYRKAYYRAFFLDPAGCSVGEPTGLCGFKRGRDYKGETRMLVFQNLHRYFLYVALAFIVLLYIDVVRSCMWPVLDESGQVTGHRFNISVSSLVLFTTTTLLACYTFSCHSLRHLVGGKLNCFPDTAAGNLRHRLWMWVSSLNRNHMLFAWLSLFMVGFSDFYVWMVARGLPDTPLF
tara:strand:+ start:124 stop:1011 length:888 start_codon:yes stop_codon:yes gene_type:complete